MLKHCPKTMNGAAMDSLDSREWCERNRDALKCSDCPVLGGDGPVVKDHPKGGRVKGVGLEQGSLF